MRIAIALALLLTSPAFADEAKGGHEMPKLIEVGPAHAYFTSMAGQWKIVQTMYMPDGKTMTAEGKQTIRTVLNGLGMAFDTETPMGPMTMLGHGFSTWVPARQKYQSTWMDNMSTHGLWIGWGTWDEKTKTMHEVTKGPDPATGKEMEMRMETKVTGPDAFTVTFYMTGADGKESKMMSMENSRIK